MVDRKCMETLPGPFPDFSGGGLGTRLVLGVHHSVDEDKILNAILSVLWLLADVTLCAISFFLNELA